MVAASMEGAPYDVPSMAPHGYFPMGVGVQAVAGDEYDGELQNYVNAGAPLIQQAWTNGGMYNSHY